MKPALVLLASLVLLSLNTQAQAQTAKLLKDINTQLVPTPSEVGAIPSQPGTPQRGFIRLGKKLLFQAATPATGLEIWVTDGTQSGTTLLKDINPGMLTSSPYNIRVTHNGKLAFFSATDGQAGSALWVTDGTSAGTKMVKDLWHGSGNVLPADIEPIGPSSVVFRTKTIIRVGQLNISTGYELFISDGTSNGTKLLKDIMAGTGASWPYQFRATQDGKKVFFSADDGTNGRELWVTDGTTTGTKMVKDIYRGKPSSRPYGPCILGSSKIVFTADNGSTGHELWISDGTAAGTRLVKDIQPGPQLGSSTAGAQLLGSKVIFSGYSTARGWEPFVTDGTSKGTVRLIDAWPGKDSGSLGHLHLNTAKTKVYWVSKTGKKDYRIFVSDGSPAGTKMFTPKNIGSWPNSPIVESLGKVYFEGLNVTPGTGWELCVSDGTMAGTKTIHDTWKGAKAGGSRALARLDALTVFFAARSSFYRSDLWKMKLGKSFQKLDTNKSKATHSSFPSGAVRFGKYVVFAATDGKVGAEVWISDGTARGTRLIKDLRPGFDGSKTHSFAAVGDKLVFDAYSLKNGTEIYVTDGTPAGTKLLKDIRPGRYWGSPVPYSSNPSSLSSAGGKVYFSANDGVTGYEPWVTDGTPAGTVLLKDINPGSPSSSPTGFAGRGDKIAFRANMLKTGAELYVTDGTTKGTTLLKDINVGPASSIPSYMTFSAGRVYFAAYDGKAGTELWVTDFTPAGTRLLKDILSGAKSSSPFHLSARYGRVFFRAFTKATGLELFVSDGTSTGTKLFLDYSPGKANTYMAHISAIGSRKVYFHVSQPSLGDETVITDGTAAGTKILDINPGTGSGLGYFDNYPNSRVTLGSQVFLRGFHPSVGAEIYTIDNGATAEPLGTPYASTWIEGSDPVLGRTATIQGGSATNLLHITLFGSLAARPIAYGKYGFVHFDLNRYYGITGISAGTRFKHSLPVPNIPTLKGVEIVFQTFSLRPSNIANTLQLSNGLQWSVGN